jgi:hypothetical protein
MLKLINKSILSYFDCQNCLSPVIKIAVGISSIIAIAYLGISAFAGYTLSIARRNFEPQKA